MINDAPYKGIALAGKAGSGKDFFARRICQVMEACDLAPVLVAFADPLKQETELLTGLPRDDPQFRAEAIRHADEMRARDPNVYVDLMRHRLARLTGLGHTPIVTDLRFRNERELCQSQGLLLVRVDAPYVERLAALQARGDEPWVLDSVHPSEVELDDAEFDLTVVNLWSSLDTLKIVAQIVAIWVGETEVVRDR